MLISAQAAAADSITTRVSLDGAGAQVYDGNLYPSINADGRFVAFHSGATSLVANDDNGVPDIFVRDRILGTTTRVSVDSVAVQANGASSSPSISADGRYVAFQSDASNLVAGDTNAKTDIFVHDRVSGATTRVSVSGSGVQANDACAGAAISANGRYVAFESRASNLVVGDSNGKYDIFVHDLSTGATVRASANLIGQQGDNDSLQAAISADASVVAFTSMATNLVGGDTNATWDIFVREMGCGVITRVSVDSAGNQVGGSSMSPALSADGRFVAFDSSAGALVPDDVGPTQDAFVHDRSTGVTTRVSIDSAGVQGNNGSYSPTISADGRIVAFNSYASNLVAGDSNGVVDVFVRNRLNGTTRRVSESSGGVQGNDDSGAARVAANGFAVAFHSKASDLVADDSNASFDVFVNDTTQIFVNGFESRP